MADDRLRVFERRWRETGDAQDRATWLVERIRAGTLDPARLEAAAACGQAAAALARAALGFASDAPALTPRARVDALCVWLGSAGPVHLAVVATERLLAAVPPERIPPMSRDMPHTPATLEWLLEKARAWLACPCEAHGFRMPTHFWLGEHELAVDLAGLLHHAAGGPVLRGARGHREPADQVARFVVELARFERVGADEALARATAAVGARLLA